MAIEMTKRCRSPGFDKITSEIIQAARRSMCSEFLALFILYGITDNCVTSGRSPYIQGVPRDKVTTSGECSLC
jgi:hypothetical protein